MKNSVIRIMICTPFKGLTNKEIKDNIYNAENVVTGNILRSYLKDDEGYDQIQILYTDNLVNYQRPSIPCDNEHMDSYKLMCVANGISNIMAECDIILFTKGWNTTRGCITEMLLALLYNKQVIALDDNDNFIQKNDLIDIVKKACNDLLSNI